MSLTQDGFVADMSMENGVVSSTAAYSMQIFHDYGLVPVAYCASGGNHVGTYYTFYVNPYHNCLIVGKYAPSAGHNNVFSEKAQPFSLTGDFVSSTDMGKYQELYRKIIRVGKEEFSKYQEMEK